MNKKQAFMYLATLQQGGGSPSEATWHTVLDVATGSNPIYVRTNDASKTIISGLPTNAQKMRISGNAYVKTGSSSSSYAQVQIYNKLPPILTTDTPVLDVYCGYNKSNSKDFTDVEFVYASLYAQSSASQQSSSGLTYDKDLGTLELDTPLDDASAAHYYAGMTINKIDLYY